MLYKKKQVLHERQKQNGVSIKQLFQSFNKLKLARTNRASVEQSPDL